MISKNNFARENKKGPIGHQNVTAENFNLESWNSKNLKKLISYFNPLKNVWNWFLRHVLQYR